MDNPQEKKNEPTVDVEPEEVEDVEMTEPSTSDAGLVISSVETIPDNRKRALDTPTTSEGVAPKKTKTNEPMTETPSTQEDMEAIFELDESDIEEEIEAEEAEDQGGDDEPEYESVDTIYSEGQNVDPVDSDEEEEHDEEEQEEEEEEDDEDDNDEGEAGTSAPEAARRAMAMRRAEHPLSRAQTVARKLKKRSVLVSNSQRPQQPAAEAAGPSQDPGPSSGSSRPAQEPDELPEADDPEVQEPMLMEPVIEPQNDPGELQPMLEEPEIVSQPMEEPQLDDDPIIPINFPVLQPAPANPPNGLVQNEPPQPSGMFGNCSILWFVTDQDIKVNPAGYLYRKYDSVPNKSEFMKSVQKLWDKNNDRLEQVEREWDDLLDVKYKISEFWAKVDRREIIEGREIDFLRKLMSKSSSEEGDDVPARPSLQLCTFTKACEQAVKEARERLNAGRNAATYSDSKSCDATTSNKNSAVMGQGRQGPIKTAQSIIEDYRMNNPEVVPRRGRRLKNPSPGIQQNQSPLSQQRRANIKEYLESVQASSNLPEVSLYPVHPPLVSTAITTAAQNQNSSSLLHGILTKSPKPNTTFSPTLARLLTAPERGIHSVKHANIQNSSGKIHNNGEITITPIAVAQNGPKVDFGSLDNDDDNSVDRLVIDEGDDEVRPNLICQNCHKKQAISMCSGCSQQWYCSRKCQIEAWDEHSEYCRPNPPAPRK